MSTRSSTDNEKPPNDIGKTPVADEKPPTTEETRENITDQKAATIEQVRSNEEQKYPGPKALAALIPALLLLVFLVALASATLVKYLASITNGVYRIEPSLLQQFHVLQMLSIRYKTSAGMAQAIYSLSPHSSYFSVGSTPSTIPNGSSW